MKALLGFIQLLAAAAILSVAVGSLARGGLRGCPVRLGVGRMSGVGWGTLLKWYLVGATALALVAGLIFGIVRWEEGRAAERAAGNAATERAIYRACDPLRNVEIDYHGAGWSESPRYEITCSDGSQRLVYPK